VKRTPSFVGDEVTSLQFSQFPGELRETPDVVSYIFDGLLTISAPPRDQILPASARKSKTILAAKEQKASNDIIAGPIGERSLEAAQTCKL
jgi:hypothetical protein